MDLNDLKIRPTVKTKSDVVVKFGRKKVVEKDHPMFAEEKETVESKTNDNFVLDMRETSRINRELILAKLRKYISNSAPGDLEKVSSKEKELDKVSSEEKKEEEVEAEIKEVEELEKESVKNDKEIAKEKEPEVKKAKPKMVIEEAKEEKEAEFDAKEENEALDVDGEVDVEDDYDNEQEYEASRVSSIDWMKGVDDSFDPFSL